MPHGGLCKPPARLVVMTFTIINYYELPTFDMIMTNPFNYCCFSVLFMIYIAYAIGTTVKNAAVI